jgi:Tol biopolymer transport system component
MLAAGCVSDTGGDRMAARPFSPAPSLADPSRFEQYSSFSPDGTEYYLSVADAEWNYRGILRSVRGNGAWSAFSPLPFAWGAGRDGGEPFVTPDARQLFFVSARAGGRPDETGMAGSAGIVQSGETDIYVSTRDGDGWSEPVRLGAPVNSGSSEWHPTVAADHSLYFASERGRQDGKADIYVARRERDGSYRHAERLDAPVNLDGANDSDPFVAPDRSYLVFHSDRPGGFGEHDLYIAFALPGGGWSEPRNLGSGINSPGWEMGPHVTSDRRLFLFTRRAAIKTDEPSRIYAVDAAALGQCGAEEKRCAR